ncbi:MAG: hypothetical protein M1818_000413 [Claussenomyces sp. TS43310]|nr:MAG: hypothetical protein M1818_000413 [Claussenomyces sp. TS43310]
MPGGKRKLEFFDPNKSDSDDEDFEVGQERSPRKAARRPGARTKRSGDNKRRRTRYGGSDVEDDDDDLSESLAEDSYSEEDEQEEAGMDSGTGRRKRQAAKKEVNYGEPDTDEIEEMGDEDEENSDDDVAPTPRRNETSRVVKLKIPSLANTSAPSTRSRRSGSVQRGRGGVSTNPTSATAAPRRSTRATTEEDEELVALSNSGRHIVRASRSPEPVGRSRVTRGSKGLKVPPSTIKEEVHETSSYEQPEAGGGAEAEAEAPVDTEMVENSGDDQGSAEDAHGDQSQPGQGVSTPAEEGEGEEEGGAGGGEEEEEEEEEGDDDDDDDDVPVMRRTRGSRASITAGMPEPSAEDISKAQANAGSRRLTRKSAARKTGQEQSSDFEPVDESAEEDISASESSPKKRKGDDDDESSPRRGRRTAPGKSKSARSSRRRRRDSDNEDDEIDRDELLEEALELKAGRRSRRAPRDSDILYERPAARVRKPVDYTIKPMDAIYAADEDADDPAPTPSRKGRGGKSGASQPWERNLHTAYGPFGGAGGPPPVIGGPWGTGATGGVDSDSSDDEGMQRSNLDGNLGMTPGSAMPDGLLPGIAQTNPGDVAAAVGGAGANLGKIKSQKALADADPLGVDQNVDFSKVGGLAGHIDQLKEMVQMPLLYPELFLRFHVTPPRGVLFHGPPGTGKTLLARALAASVGSGGQKITFYMRKGADALSKWVGEAERQLRLLFEEARKTQPSIIFFDEIDGLAPVRSSKQEQIHASIVSTLLALMDGMDGRGQVIVIGATNRPDNIDPALRRPGRFDREFYFPLPDLEGRKSIVNIHTKDWGIDEAFKTSLAHATKGYGGADLRALCTEAALNAIQRTYPQIYSSNNKLVIDPETIKITAKDFMLSIKKMIPSSERATSSGAAPLPKVVEPLLRDQLKAIKRILDGLIPVQKKVTALQEAMFEQFEDDDHGFQRETLQQDFEKSRIFRPRLLISGMPGMGQAYLGAALLNHFEGLHVQNFDLPTIYSDSARSAETAIVQLFAEVKRHKPSVIYLPGIDTWYHTLSEAVITTFLGLLRAIPPTDPILVLGIADSEPKDLSHGMVREFFGFSKKNQYNIERPSRAARHEFFTKIIEYIRMGPREFPDPLNRKLRKLPELEVAPPPPPKIPSKEELKAQRKRDMQLLNALKICIQPIMEQINRKYKKLRNPVIPQSQIQYLFDEQDPNYVRPDVVQFRPFELDKDKDGITVIKETASGKIFYNLEITTIEERLSNGFYARPKDFLADIRSLAKDARRFGDRDRILRANDLLANVSVDIETIENMPAFANVEGLYQRQMRRTKEKLEKYRKRAEVDAGLSSLLRADIPQPGLDAATDDHSGPLTLGEPISGSRFHALSTPFSNKSALSNGYSGTSSQHHSHQNGSSATSRNSGEDVHMGGTDESAHQTPTVSQAMGPPALSSRGPSNLSSHPTGRNVQPSQHSAVMEIPADLSPNSLINPASTTTSGQTQSKPPSSGVNNTPLTNGNSQVQGDSQLLDTQRDSQMPDSQHAAHPESQRESQLPESQRTAQSSSGEKEWAHSQAQAMARGQFLPPYHSQTPSSGSQRAVAETRVFDAARGVTTSRQVGSLLSHDGAGDEAGNTGASSSQASSQKEVIIDEEQLAKMLENMVQKSSGCSIEQLEQINRELMDEIWTSRGEWNRSRVASQLGAVFSTTILDIEEMQKVLKPSQDF